MSLLPLPFLASFCVSTIDSRLRGRCHGEAVTEGEYRSPLKEEAFAAGKAPAAKPPP